MPPSIDFSHIRAALAVGGGSSPDFDLNADDGDPASGTWVDAAVLVPLIERPTGLNVILTERAANLSHHAGQVAFPGGRAAPGDSGLLETALREAREEIGLHPGQTDILGQCPRCRTVTGFNVHPFAASVTGEFRPVLQKEEVADVFEVPFDFLAEPENYRIETAGWRGTGRRYYAVRYETRFIWGATAAILFGLARRLRKQRGA